MKQLRMTPSPKISAALVISFRQKAVDNGVLARNGHTEATADSASGRAEASRVASAEIMADDGTMMRTAELDHFRQRA